MSESIKNILLKLRGKAGKTLPIDAPAEQESLVAHTPSSFKEPENLQDLAELVLGCRIAPTAAQKKNPSK